MEKERDSNFELLRIISMFLIVLGHIIMHGKVLENCTNPGLKIILEIIMMILIVHVNSFVLITGYFQSTSKFKQSKLWSIISTNWFYKALILIIFSILNIETFSNLDKFINLFPLNLSDYWFINTYLITYCLSPYLNKLIDSLKKKDYQKLLIVLFIIFSVFPYTTGNRIFQNDGYSLYNFIFLYLIGAYLRRYPLKDSYLFKNFSNNLFQVTMIGIFFFCVLINYSFYQTANSILGINSLFDLFGTSIVDMTLAYSNPIVIIQSVSFFTLFGTFKFKNKFINKMSQLTLGIYIIHDNTYVRKNIYKWLRIDGPKVVSYRYIIYVLVCAIIIYVGCTLIELIRQLLFKKISEFKVSKKIKEKYYSYINNFYIKSTP